MFHQIQQHGRIRSMVDNIIHENRGLLWSWSYGSWIYNYLCNQCLSPLTLWVKILLRQGVLDTTLSDKVCQLLAADWWFSQGTPVSSTNKTDCHNITEIVLKVALNAIILTHENRLPGDKVISRFPCQRTIITEIIATENKTLFKTQWSFKTIFFC